MIEGTFSVTIVNDNGSTSSIGMTNADLTSLEIVKDEFNNVFLSGNVTLIGDDFDTVLNERVNRDTSQLAVDYGGYTGVMKTDGEFHYDRRVCTLEVGDPESFETIINLEFRPENNRLEFEFNSYNVKIYATDGYDPVTYSECVSDSPLPWNINTNYVTRAQEVSSGVWLGDNGNTVTDTLGNIYFSIKSNNQGNNPEDEVDPINSPEWWFLPFGLNPKTYGQERSLFKFDDDATYDKYNKYWYSPGCGGGYYSTNIAGVNIKENLQTQLQEYGYDLSYDWLAYPKYINSLYENKLWLASTEIKNTTTIFELIEIIQQTFNCVYVVKNKLLKFIWEGERYDDWNIYLPKQEHNLESTDIFDWTNSSNKSVKRHVLKFTESDLGTHDNSIIEYDNNFTEDSEVKSNFDVDLVYSYNEGDTPCLIVTDEFNEPSRTNPYLIPSLLHETFYFVNREFKQGTFNGNLVTLQLGLFEESTKELDGSYELSEWDVEYSIKINPLTSNVTEQFAVADEIKYSIDKNKYTLKLRTKN